MYIDLIVVILLLLISIFYFKKFSKFVYFVGLLELFFRLASFLKANLAIKELDKILNYIPASIFALLAKYTKGILFSILAWACFIILVIFFYYILKIFLKRKKY